MSDVSFISSYIFTIATNKISLLASLWLKKACLFITLIAFFSIIYNR